jgi:outer membrane protein assembly factor BamE (lipoprotein component of BamABCDE complex)
MRRLKISNIVLGAAIIFMMATASGGQKRRTSQYVISYNSFGPVKVGMTVAQGSKALGIPLVREEWSDGETCYYVSPKRGFKDVSFMVTNGRISRVDISARGFTTDRGAKIGDSEARIKRLYKGMVKVRQHPYVDGHYLMIYMKGGKFSIFFETDGKRVTSFRAGKSREVGYIEGCS